MKLKQSLWKPTKIVNFHGIDLVVSGGQRWVAVDKSGYVYSYLYEPQICGTIWSGYSTCEQIGEVDLEGFDWKQSLMEI